MRTRRIGAVKLFKNVKALSGSDSRSAVFDREALMAVLKGLENRKLPVQISRPALAPGH